MGSSPGMMEIECLLKCEITPQFQRSKYSENCRSKQNLPRCQNPFDVAAMDLFVGLEVVDQPQCHVIRDPVTKRSRGQTGVGPAPEKLLDVAAGSIDEVGIIAAR